MKRILKFVYCIYLLPGIILSILWIYIQVILDDPKWTNFGMKLLLNEVDDQEVLCIIFSISEKIMLTIVVIILSYILINK